MIGKPEAAVSDRFSPPPLPFLLGKTLQEVRRQRFMGIPAQLFYRPAPGDRFSTRRFGELLGTPLGVAAGPHTQLALNIVAAWLCGARYIELKTIQTLEDLEIPRPCIDMQDAGYNCEWSQELTVRQSFNEYLNAWILIHLLHGELGLSGPVATIFNMSVGYDLAGIMQPNVQWFLEKMTGCRQERDDALETVRGVYPLPVPGNIPARISGNVTLSTMHGCPPGEIEKIGLYLLKEKRLHTTIKLNPTLLGAGPLREILNTHSGFEAEVPDEAFAHDPSFEDAVRIIGTLKAAALAEGLQFSVKLTNTLECRNHRDVFPGEVKMMYLSGRALHRVSVALAARLQETFRGSLDLSFSAGADCFNIADLVSCGLGPVTVCSDLLKPGGYGRLSQYILNLREAFRSTGAESLDDFIVKKAGTGRDVASSAMLNLAEYAGKVLENPAYSRDEEGEPSIKTGRTLEWFDCVHAPCRDACPTRQDIPEYMRRMAAGDSEGALKAIRITNPFPCVTGMICDQPCREKCTRINYDEPLQIREIKRFAAEGGRLPEVPVSPRPGGRGKASVIGAGPAGLSCAWFLRSAGFEVDVYERNGMPGGMVAAAIPAFRLPDDAIAKDIDAILAAGIRLHTGRTVDRSFLETLLATSDAVFMASGAQKTIPLRIPGADAAGVTDPLSFLFSSRNDRPDLAGRRVVVVGGGNTAMDAARTAYRLVGEEGSVTVAYRRAAREMPADRGEIRAARAEGIIIMELVTPVRVVETNGHVQGLQCTRNRQGGKGPDGRREAIPIPGTEFIIPCDLIIPAIGQQPDAELADPDLMKTQPGSYRTRIPNLFIGGDALRGASTAINAVADGRLAAQEIIGTVTTAEGLQPPVVHCEEILAGRAVRLPGWHPDEPPDESRRSFIPSEPAMTLREAVEEASRCLGCDEICNVCVSVCPNLANFSYEVEPVRLDLEKALKNADGTIDILQDAVFTVRQRYQILNLNDLCNECGNCATFCPTSGRPFTDKPRLFLGAASFNQAVGGFLFTRHGGREVLIFREKDNIRTLTLTEGVFVYETNQVRARIEPSTFRLLKVDFLTPCVKEARFTFAAEMSIIMQGARQALPHLT